MSLSIRRRYSLTVGVLVLFWAGSLWAYPTLPGEIPVHFGPLGTPDRLAVTTIGRWLLLPTIATLVAGFVCGLERMLPHLSAGLNMPRQDTYDALSEANQRRVIQVVQKMMIEIAILMTVVFTSVQAHGYAIAMDASGVAAVMGPAVLWLTMGGLLVLVAIRLVQMRRLVDRLYARQNETN